MRQKTDNIKLLFLSGTPCINHPYEITFTIDVLGGPALCTKHNYSEQTYSSYVNDIETVLLSFYLTESAKLELFQSNPKF